MKGYKPVSIPDDLYNLIAIIIQDRSLGYRSISDFVISTLRNKTHELRLVQMKKIEMKERKSDIQTFEDLDDIKIW